MHNPTIELTRIAVQRYAGHFMRAGLWIIMHIENQQRQHQASRMDSMLPDR